MFKNMLLRHKCHLQKPTLLFHTLTDTIQTPSSLTDPYATPAEPLTQPYMHANDYGSSLDV